jgi:hypothetical protein
MTSERRRPATWRDVFGIPIALGLLSLAGLLSALLFDGAVRIFSWVAVASPLVVTCWVFLRRNKRL